jgi:hypothetical protein
VYKRQLQNLREATNAALEFKAPRKYQKPDPEVERLRLEDADWDPRRMNDTDLARLVEAVKGIRVEDMPYGGSAVLKMVGQLLSVNGLSRIYDGTTNLAKSGVLGGALWLNPAYHMTNFLTAPAIITATLGPKVALTAFHLDAVKVVKHLYSLRRPGGRLAEEVLFRSPDGKVWTTSMLADMVAELSIARSQASAEVSADVIRDTIRWSGMTGDGSKVGTMRDFARRLANPTSGLNVFTEVANASDVLWRTGVVRRALIEGRSSREAFKMGREALFDYGRMADWEKRSIARVIWFWRFARENMRSVLRALINNPSRAARLAKLSRGLPQSGDYHLDQRSWDESRPFLMLMDDEEAGENYAVYGPSVPFAGGMADLIEYTAVLAPILDPAVASGNAFPETVTNAANLLMGKAQPAISTPFVALGFEPKFSRVDRPSKYLDPRYIAAIQANPYLWEAFTSVVRIEPVPPERQNPGDTTYWGKQWQIADNKSAKRWLFIRRAALTVGVERVWKDTGRLLIGEREGETTGPELEAGVFDIPAYLGLVRTAKEIPERNIPVRNRATAERELREVR